MRSSLFVKTEIAYYLAKEKNFNFEIIKISQKLMKYQLGK